MELKFKDSSHALRMNLIYYNTVITIIKVNWHVNFKAHPSISTLKLTLDFILYFKDDWQTSLILNAKHPSPILNEKLGWYAIWEDRLY